MAKSKQNSPNKCEKQISTKLRCSARNLTYGNLTKINIPQRKWSESSSVISYSLGPHGLQPTRLLCPWNSPGQNTGVGSRFFLLGIFPTQGLNPGLQHCGRILYLLSHQGSPVVVAGRPLSVQALVVVHTGFVALQLSCSSKEDIQNFLLNQAFLSTLGRVLLRAPHSDSGPFLHCALLNSAYIGSSCQDLWLCGCHSD